MEMMLFQTKHVFHKEGSEYAILFGTVVNFNDARSSVSIHIARNDTSEQQAMFARNVCGSEGQGVPHTRTWLCWCVPLFGNGRPPENWTG